MDALVAMARFRVRMVDAVDRNLHHDQRRAYLIDLLREGFGIEADEGIEPVTSGLQSRERPTTTDDDRRRKTPNPP